MASQVRFPITNDDEANALLVEDPLALLLGMLLDQQVPMEWAFRAPFTLSQRLGERFNATDIAAMDQMTELFDRLLALLAKRFGKRPDGWAEAVAPFGDDQPRSAADVSSKERFAEVRAWKKAQKAAGRSKADFSM